MANPNEPLKPALLVIDVQRDFCEGGVLAAQFTSTLIDPLNRLVESCLLAEIPVIFTRDWHPPDHSSFLSHGGPWPAHCVWNTRGAEFAAGLRVPSTATVINKGVARDDSGYSMFDRTNLPETLKALDRTELAVCGIAAEYCVLASVKDSRHRAFRTIVLEDLVRAIEVRPGDADRAFNEMRSLEAVLSTSDDWMRTVC
jgi:nicotinamidase/pyrazinamidase